MTTGYFPVFSNCKTGDERIVFVAAVIDFVEAGVQLCNFPLATNRVSVQEDGCSWFSQMRLHSENTFLAEIFSSGSFCCNTVI